MSGPSAISRRFWEDLLHGNLADDLIYSGTNFLIGFTLAVISGIVAGVLIGWYRRLAMLVNPFLAALYATPRIALMPLIIIWFGIDLSASAGLE